MKQRIPELDGLRALAILGVFCHHCVGVYGKVEFLGLQHGWIGVDLFFVISGTLITTILLNLKSSSKPYFATFYSRRALRIFPPYFALLLLCFVGSIVRSTLHSPSFWVLQLTLFSSWFVYGSRAIYPSTVFLVLWSLSVEEQFYLLWAPVVRWASRRTLFLVTCGALAFSPVLRYFIHDAVGTEYKFVPARLDGLACGALLALLISHEGYRRKLYWVFHNVWLCPAILIGSFVAVGWTKYREFGSHWFSVIGYSLISVAFLFLVAYSLEQTGTNSVLCRLLRSEPWQNIGKVSYVFYLIHLPIRAYLNSFLLLHLGKGYAQKTLTLAGSFGLTWVLANLSWRYFESPILR